MNRAGKQASEITADFTEKMLDARPDTNLATLARTALAVLSHRYPTGLLHGHPNLVPNVGNLPSSQDPGVDQLNQQGQCAHSDSDPAG